jgi:hypothetical protein
VVLEAEERLGRASRDALGAGVLTGDALGAGVLTGDAVGAGVLTGTRSALAC